jgi:uncharacterized protein YfiM (DUF2279 family)
MMRVALGIALLCAAPAMAGGWIGPDKAAHFGISLGLSSAGYALTATLTQDRPARLMGGALFAIAAGAAWELASLRQPCAGQASWRDMAANAAGALTGLVLSYLVDRLLSARAVGSASSSHVSQQNPRPQSAHR